VSSLFD